MQAYTYKPGANFSTAAIRASLPKIEVPIIRIEDWGHDPPIATKYFSGDNELNFEVIYPKLKALPHHPGRGRLEIAPEAGIIKVRLRECDHHFLETFWECAAHLLDYFADFLVHDSSTMQSIWFHLLDMLREAGDLPHLFWLQQGPHCSHARQFAQQYDQLLEVINIVITVRKLPPGTAPLCPNLPSNISGDFKAGLKPWQQFLYNGSPGFGVSEADQVYSQNAYNASEDTVSERFIPTAALAIISRHTERAKALLAKLVQKTGDPSYAEMLAEFDYHSLKIGEQFAYTSIEDQNILAQPLHVKSFSANMPRRSSVLIDPSMVRRDPDLNLLDECIGSCRGVGAFVLPGGSDIFQMLRITSTKASTPNTEHPGIIRKEYSDMFDDWELGEDA